MDDAMEYDDDSMHLPNADVTWDGWYTLCNMLHHIWVEVGDDFKNEVKDTALGYR